MAETLSSNPETNFGVAHTELTPEQIAAELAAEFSDTTPTGMTSEEVEELMATASDYEFSATPEDDGEALATAAEVGEVAVEGFLNAGSAETKVAPSARARRVGARLIAMSQADTERKEQKTERKKQAAHNKKNQHSKAVGLEKSQNIRQRHIEEAKTDVKFAEKGYKRSEKRTLVQDEADRLTRERIKELREAGTLADPKRVEAKGLKGRVGSRLSLWADKRDFEKSLKDIRSASKEDAKQTITQKEAEAAAQLELRRKELELAELRRKQTDAALSRTKLRNNDNQTKTFAKGRDAKAGETAEEMRIRIGQLNADIAALTPEPAYEAPVVLEPAPEVSVPAPTFEDVTAMMPGGAAMFEEAVSSTGTAHSDFEKAAAAAEVTAGSASVDKEFDDTFGGVPGFASAYGESLDAVRRTEEARIAAEVARIAEQEAAARKAAEEAEKAKQAAVAGKTDPRNKADNTNPGRSRGGRGRSQGRGNQSNRTPARV